MTLLIKGYANSLQATIIIPYPGTPLFNECKENNILLTEDYDDFDQRTCVIKSPLNDDEIKKAIRSVYKVAFNPLFLIHKIINIRSIEDFKSYCSAATKVIGHLLDFKEGNNHKC